MEGPAPAGLPWVSACGERRCQSHMRRLSHNRNRRPAVAHSWKAQHRLHKVFKRLAFRKNNQIAAVAVARELVGFVWAIMQESAAEIEAGRAAA